LQDLRQYLRNGGSNTFELLLAQKQSVLAQQEQMKQVQSANMNQIAQQGNVQKMLNGISTESWKNI
jgi:hypothetical protein